MPIKLPHCGSRILLKALLGTSAVVAAVVVSLSGLFLLRHQEAFQNQLELRAESLASSLAGQSQFDLLVDNRAELARMARNTLASSADVAYVVVEDASGAFITSAQRTPLARSTLPRGNPDIKRPAIRDVRAGPSELQCVEAGVPVIAQAEGGVLGIGSRQAEFLGRIRVGMSLQSQHVLFLSTLRHVTLIALFILAGAFLVDYFRIRKLLKPLVELVQVAKAFGQGGRDFRAISRSNDEIGVLVDSFNEMLDKVEERTRELHEQVEAKERARAELASAQQRLVDLSRQSGMAEIATSVLHNVGNVLNSVNVSAGLVAAKVRNSRIDKLPALMDMLQQHSDHLEDYLRNDVKGQRTLPYLEKLGNHLLEERRTMLEELALLTGHIDHIKRIVATQQNYAKVSGLVEEFSLTGLVEDALRIQQPGFERHHVAVVRDFEEIPPLISDKHQILQILLNLLRNARQAVTLTGKPDGLIRVRIRQDGEDRVRIEVKDSGIGMEPENLTRIFAHGFTTKADGHGFGLHSGALAARQLGGSLWAESEGPGSGAAFTLELPLVPTTARRGGALHELDIH